MGVNYTTPYQFPYIPNDRPSWSYLCFCAIGVQGDHFPPKVSVGGHFKHAIHDNTMESGLLPTKITTTT